MELNSIEENPDDKPLPTDFASFLPWACRQLQVGAEVLIKRVTQSEYISATTSDRTKGKLKSKAKDISNADTVPDKVKSSFELDLIDDEKLKITAVYDTNENLIQMKLEKNKRIPRNILKIISLIIVYQKNLQTITIDGGMDRYTLYEIGKFLKRSSITEIYLDDTFIKEANYDILLKDESNLMNLSLARCKLSDEVIKKIASKLVYPLPASKSLTLLNLSSNNITDVGAAYLGEVLRSNRQLRYLNLSSNMITDEGAKGMLNMLVKFSLTGDEVFESRTRNISYLRAKAQLVSKTITELKAGDFDKRNLKRKNIRPFSAPRKTKAERDGSFTTLLETPLSISIAEMDALLLEKAEEHALKTLGCFRDPFSKLETVQKDGVFNCFGNNTLSYLNLAYNNLSCLTINKFIQVLVYQRLANRMPRGLISLCIEGNYLPSSCKELTELQHLLDLGLMSPVRTSAVKKSKLKMKSQNA